MLPPGATDHSPAPKPSKKKRRRRKPKSVSQHALAAKSNPFAALFIDAPSLTEVALVAVLSPIAESPAPKPSPAATQQSPDAESTASTPTQDSTSPSPEPLRVLPMKVALTPAGVYVPPHARHNPAPTDARNRIDVAIENGGWSPSWKPHYPWQCDSEAPLFTGVPSLPPSVASLGDDPSDMASIASDDSTLYSVEAPLEILSKLRATILEFHTGPLPTRLEPAKPDSPRLESSTLPEPPQNPDLEKAVSDLLDRLGLKHYAPLFQSERIFNMRRVERLQNCHLKELGLKIGERADLLGEFRPFSRGAQAATPARSCEKPAGQPTAQPDLAEARIDQMLEHATTSVPEPSEACTEATSLPVLTEATSLPVSTPENESPTNDKQLISEIERPSETASSACADSAPVTPVSRSPNKSYEDKTPDISERRPKAPPAPWELPGYVHIPDYDETDEAWSNGKVPPHSAWWSQSWWKIADKKEECSGCCRPEKAHKSNKKQEVNTKVERMARRRARAVRFGDCVKWVKTGFGDDAQPKRLVRDKVGDVNRSWTLTPLPNGKLERGITMAVEQTQETFGFTFCGFAKEALEQAGATKCKDPNWDEMPLGYDAAGRPLFGVRSKRWLEKTLGETSKTKSTTEDAKPKSAKSKLRDWNLRLRKNLGVKEESNAAKGTSNKYTPPGRRGARAIVRGRSQDGKYGDEICVVLDNLPVGTSQNDVVQLVSQSASQKSGRFRKRLRAGKHGDFIARGFRERWVQVDTEGTPIPGGRVTYSDPGSAALVYARKRKSDTLYVVPPGEGRNSSKWLRPGESPPRHMAKDLALQPWIQMLAQSSAPAVAWERQPDFVAVNTRRGYTAGETRPVWLSFQGGNASTNADMVIAAINGYLYGGCKLRCRSKEDYVARSASGTAEKSQTDGRKKKSNTRSQQRSFQEWQREIDRDRAEAPALPEPQWNQKTSHETIAVMKEAADDSKSATTEASEEPSASAWWAVAQRADRSLVARTTVRKRTLGDIISQAELNTTRKMVKRRRARLQEVPLPRTIEDHFKSHEPETVSE